MYGVNRLLNKLERICERLVEKSQSLDSTILDTDDECIINLKTELTKAAEELENGIVELRTYYSTMKDQKKW